MSHRSPLAPALLAGLMLAASAAYFTVDAQKASAKPVVKRAAVKTPLASLPVDGSKMFSMTCAACHQVTGEGLGETYPPLVASEWVTGSDARMVRIILHGMSGPVDVAGQSFDGAMPAWGGVLKDAEIAAIATYVRGAWGNKAAPITAEMVAAIRTATSSRKTPWTAPEITQVPALVK